MKGTGERPHEVIAAPTVSSAFEPVPRSGSRAQFAVETVDDERAEQIAQVLFADCGHLRSALEQPPDCPLWFPDDLDPACTGDGVPEVER